MSEDAPARRQDGPPVRSGSSRYRPRRFVSELDASFWRIETARERRLMHRRLRPLKGDAARIEVSGSVVPIPLPAAAWSKAVFHRSVAPADLFAAVMSDPAAALLAHGLAALDDETLQFFVDHPAVVTRLYEHDAPAFAGFAEHLRIHDNHVVPPGGCRAVPLWEALLNESRGARSLRPRAVREDEGRIAYLTTPSASLNHRARRLRSACGSRTRARVDRFKRWPCWRRRASTSGTSTSSRSRDHCRIFCRCSCAS